MKISRYKEAAPFALSTLFVVIGLCLYYVRLAGTKSTIILHFIGGYGADALGSSGSALGMLIFGAAMTATNLALAAALWPRNRDLSRVTGVLTAFMSLLILVAVCGIIAIN